jgi:hypothetical protein
VVCTVPRHLLAGGTNNPETILLAVKRARGGSATGPLREPSSSETGDYPRSTAQGLPISIQLTVMSASRGFGSGAEVTSDGPGFVDDLKAQDFSRPAARRGNLRRDAQRPRLSLC